MGFIEIVFPLLVFSPFIVFIIIGIGGMMQAKQEPQKSSREEQFDDWYNNIRR